MHPGQLTVAEPLVAELIGTQFPDWAGLPVRAIGGQGTVNALFRLGDELVARFPLEQRDDARAWLEREAAAARELAGATTVPTPRPVAIGAPGDGYPMPWSVQTWVPGTVVSAADVSGSDAFARDLAAFVLEVRAIDTRARTFVRSGVGSGRGGHLPDHDAWVEECLRRSAGLFDVDAARALWARLRELPERDADVMTHGDLVGGNVLVAGDRLAGVIDVGGLGPADPALDLVAAWHLLDGGPREAFRAVLGSDDHEWRRGMAWALEQALGLGWYYRDTNPVVSRMGLTTMARLLAAGRA